MAQDLTSNLALQQIGQYMTKDHLEKVKLFTIYAELRMYSEIDKADTVHEVYRVLEAKHESNAAPLLKYMLRAAGVPKGVVDKFEPDSDQLRGIEEGFLDFGALIIDVINELSSDDFRDLKYLIPNDKLQQNPGNISSAVDLFRKLQQNRVVRAIDPASLNEFAQWLDAVHRKDLGDMVRDYKRRKQGSKNAKTEQVCIWYYVHVFQ